MDTSRVWIVVCGTIFLVVGINAAIYAMLARQNGVRQVDLLRTAFRRSRQPWQPEEDALRELSQRVKDLERSDPDHTIEPPEPK